MQLNLLVPERPTLAAVATCFGSMSYGYTIGFSSPSTYQIQSMGYMTKFDAAVFGSLLALALLVGTISAARIVDKKGRKFVAMCATIPFAMGWLILYSSNIYQLFLGRALTGFASGMTLTSVPTYISEIASPDRRGALGSTVQLSITVGICLAYYVGVSHTWYQMALCGMVIALLNIMAMISVPESPRWLVMMKHIPEAKASLQWLNVNDAEGEISDIQKSLNPVSNGLSLTTMWAKRSVRSPLIIVSLVMVFQQTCGINAVMFYTQEIFSNAGFDQTSGTAALTIGVVQVVATAVACLLVDKLGRRQLLIAAATVMSLACFAFAYYYQLEPEDQQRHRSLAVNSLICYIIGFALGWGPIPVLLMSELFSSDMRGTASSVTLSINNVVSFIVSFTFLPLISSYGASVVFMMFGISSVLSALYVHQCVPETKGKTLEDIQSALEATDSTSTDV